MQPYCPIYTRMLEYFLDYFGAAMVRFTSNYFDKRWVPALRLVGIDHSATTRATSVYFCLDTQ
jgi:hypothetical protein